MNLIIPIGGKGERFRKDDYLNPKPLIFSKGKRILFWVLDSLKLDPQDIIFIVYNRELEKFQLEELIEFNYPSISFRFIKLEKDTNGPVETVSIALNHMNEVELSQLTLVLDSDTFCKDDIILKSKEINDNIIFYGNNDNENPIYSYIQIDRQDLVIEIKEKVKISDNICIGSYCFKSAEILKSTIDDLLKNEISEEIYISAIYDLMIKKNLKVKSVFVENFYCLGTPLQLKSFSSNFIDEKKYRICFDLDNTLVTYPQKVGDYSSVEPIKENIDFLNFLYSMGHTIIIYTARRMRTHNGNVNAVKKDIEKVTLETLDNFGINYHEIIFGKPYANFYIDDLSVNPSFNLEKQLGFYNVHPEPRYFNKIEIKENSIIKRSTKIDGELHYYKNIPNSIKIYFPKLISFGDGFLEIEKINGLTISFLNINNNLSETIFNKILNSLKKIHSTKVNERPLDIYGNYCKKIESRLNLIDYSQFEGSNVLIRNTLNFLLEYEKNKKGVFGVIHGDPVFSNIIHLNDDELKFIDMRGEINEVFTICGDIFYDYAKIYQSVIGYDFILFNKEWNSNIVEKNKKIFNNFIISNFGIDRLENIKQITKSLIISLLPLHNEDEKRIKYFNLIKEI